jgi:protein O-GlcNAc transferase
LALGEHRQGLNTTEVESLLASGKSREALELATRGASSHPGDAQWLHLLGVTLHACGRGRDAVARLREATSADPGNAFIWNTLGGVLLASGDPSEARAALAEALRLDPASSVARFNLAMALKQRGEYAAARTHLENLLANQPDDSTRFEMAVVLLAEGNAQQALVHLDDLQKKHPTQAQLLAHQAYALASLGRGNEAADAARRAIAAAPQSIEIRSTAAGALALTGLATEAQQHFAAIAAARPDTAAHWQKLGVTALASGDLRQAVEAFARHAALVPGNRAALTALGSALVAADAREDAIKVFERALEAGHRDAGVLAALVHAKATVCDWNGLDELVKELRAIASAPSPTPAMPQAAVYFETTPKEQRAWAQNWARAEFARTTKTFEAPGSRAGRRTRVGYLSGDFFDHATSYLMAGLLERHDRSRYEVFAYSASHDDASPTRKRVVGAVEHFVDVREMPAWQAAQRIASDRLDVLIDLGGYVKNSAIGVLALRPAPLQGHFLGYPGTTGASFVDFVIGDAITIPPGSEDAFSERVLRMPACYQPNDPARSEAAAKPRSAFGIAEDALVLCSFNQGVKIRADVFARWCKLLEALPDAILWITSAGDAANTRLHAAARAHGIDAKRIVFAPHLPHEEHIARLRNADIAIDTFPCTSHTTASDALWAGVPLVTHYGETFASRVAASVLHAAGCAQWAFADAAAAFDATLALARDPNLRSAARQKLAGTLRNSPLFDIDTYARDFEARIEEALGPA